MNRGCLLAMHLLLCVLLAQQATGDGTLDSLHDGWNTWRVPASADAPAWCCLRWNTGRPVPQSCELEDDDRGFSSAEGLEADEVQIYALLRNGQPEKIRALSPQCEVSTNADIKDLGLLAADASAQWLRQFVEPRSAMSTDLLAALSVHGGIQSLESLLAFARVGRDIDNRKDAIFWMGQLRSAETLEALRSLVYEDPIEQIREQAIFALSQLPADAAATELIRLVESRDLQLEDRREALFWLAQCESDLVTVYMSKLFAGN